MATNGSVALFSYFNLRVQNIAIKLNDNGLLVLALLVAESEPAQKDILIKLIINILAEGSF